MWEPCYLICLLECQWLFSFDRIPQNNLFCLSYNHPHPSSKLFSERRVYFHKIQSDLGFRFHVEASFAVTFLPLHCHLYFVKKETSFHSHNCDPLKMQFLIFQMLQQISIEYSRVSSFKAKIFSVPYPQKFETDLVE